VTSSEKLSAHVTPTGRAAGRRACAYPLRRASSIPIRTAAAASWPLAAGKMARTRTVAIEIPAASAATIRPDSGALRSEAARGSSPVARRRRKCRQGAKASQREAMEDARRLLDDVARACRGEEMSQRAEFGSPIEVLMRALEDEHADFLVVGTRGRGAMRSVLLAVSGTRCWLSRRVPSWSCPLTPLADHGLVASRRPRVTATARGPLARCSGAGRRAGRAVGRAARRGGSRARTGSALWGACGVRSGTSRCCRRP
jgi:nucleotide-binding universal stress UspA family protein